MIQTLTKNWLWLALCGIVEAVIAAVYLIMEAADGPLTFHSWHSTIVFLGRLELAAGASMIAAAILRSTQGKSWPLGLNGLALCTLGLIQNGFTGFRISFLTVALLVIVMAISSGVLALLLARSQRRLGRHVDGRCLVFAGAASVAFACVFLALGFRWIRIEPGSHPDLLWLGAYFGFSAICLLALALRLRSLGPSQSDRQETLPSFGNPNLAR